MRDAKKGKLQTPIMAKQTKQKRTRQTVAKGVFRF